MGEVSRYAKSDLDYFAQRGGKEGIHNGHAWDVMVDNLDKNYDSVMLVSLDHGMFPTYIEVDLLNDVVGDTITVRARGNYDNQEEQRFMDAVGVEYNEDNDGNPIITLTPKRKGAHIVGVRYDR